MTIRMRVGIRRKVQVACRALAMTASLSAITLMFAASAVRSGSRGVDLPSAQSDYSPNLPLQDTSGGFVRVQYPGYPPVVRCLTPAGACFVQGAAPPGAACWCATPYGPVAGRVG